MRQAILVGPRHFAIVEREPAPPGVGQVQVRVDACGVCASDLGAWEEGRPEGAVLGHEAAGRVVAVGPGVTEGWLGADVSGFFHGGFAELATTTVDRILRVPPGLEEAAPLGEPLACVVAAACRVQVQPGDKVAIVGAGFMGLTLLQLLRGGAASRLLAIEPRPDARERALALGAHEATSPDAPLLANDRSGGWIGGADLVVEASGTPAGLELAGRLAREHGILLILGYHNSGGGRREVDLQLWNWKALDVVNGHERRTSVKLDALRRGLKLLEAGQVDVVGLVSHRVTLERINEIFQALRDKPSGYAKGLVEVPSTIGGRTSINTIPETLHAGAPEEETGR